MFYAVELFKTVCFSAVFLLLFIVIVGSIGNPI